MESRQGIRAGVMGALPSETELVRLVPCSHRHGERKEDKVSDPVPWELVSSETERRQDIETNAIGSVPSEMERRRNGNGEY